MFEKYNYGTTIFSPLAASLLTGLLHSKFLVVTANPLDHGLALMLVGKYNDGIIPSDSRFATSQNDWVKFQLTKFSAPELQNKIAKVRELTEIANELGVRTAQLALAWIAKNPRVSTMITGASKPDQIIENLAVLDVLPKITEEVYTRIDAIFPLKE